MIALYINNRLCDTGRDFSVRLNRQLLNPGELNTKDAQFSYSIALPPTSNNREIFNYAIIEETRDKFNREYTAELIIGSIRVFKGLFRLSGITNDKYRGNLYTPAHRSLKDIFGDLKLNESGALPLPFTTFSESVSGYNIQAKTSTPAAIFPYTLYGLLPKVPSGDGSYTARDVWDNTVRFGIQDMPPSVNVLQALRAIFASKGLTLAGSAFADERLSRLYMSYRNPEDYTQPWNWGRMGHIKISGLWENRISSISKPEWSSQESVDEFDNVLYNTDLFNAYRSNISKDIDEGGNVLLRELPSERQDGDKIKSALLTIPVSGVYKIVFHASLKISDTSGLSGDPETGAVACVEGPNATLYNKRYEIKLLRDRKKADFNISGGVIDGVFYRNNLNQLPNVPESYSPKYFPNIVQRRQINFIDKAQNGNILVGFTFGRIADKPETLNPKDDGHDIGQILVAKPAVSWDNDFLGEEPDKIAINSPGYYKRVINEEGDIVNVKPDKDLYKIGVNGQPDIFAELGYYDGQYNNNRRQWQAEGSVSVLAYLEKGEALTIGCTCQQNMTPFLVNFYGQPGVTVKFDLEITPFQTARDWLTVDNNGNSTAPMDWNAGTDFVSDSINLIKFLPSEMKADDFIDNFCKAFNLGLSQVSPTVFELNAKQAVGALSNRFINLDGLVSVRDRANAPLGLPSLYKLGFTVSTDEEGYAETGDDGGGEYETRVTEVKIVEQKSSFSFNWFKNILKGGVILPLAVISKREAWAEPSYAKAMAKRYPNQALRFWYPDGLLNDLPTTFEFNGSPMFIAKVSNELPGLNVLDYKNKKGSILDNYFTIFINGDSHYTEIEGYLTPDQYDGFNGSIMAMFNGDLYHVAEISGYDPAGRNKAKIKLIRKI
jgi:hypothetical protein